MNIVSVKATDSGSKKMGADPHLVVDLSGHGYGHAGMTIPILKALRCRTPRLKLTIRTTVPVGWLAERIESPFDVVQQSDFGMAMADARRVLPDESLATYSRIHADWPGKIAAATEQLAALKPTLLLSNITYLSLAAAKHLRVPSIAFGPLNWRIFFTTIASIFPALKIFGHRWSNVMPIPSVFFRPFPLCRCRAYAMVVQWVQSQGLDVSESLNCADVLV